jgi:hypothetical protein
MIDKERVLKLPVPKALFTFVPVFFIPGCVTPAYLSFQLHPLSNSPWLCAINSSILTRKGA